MNRKLNFALVLLLGLIMLGVTACSDDDPVAPPAPVDQDEAWIGVWRSEGANVAPIVFADPVNVDIAEATFNSNNTIALLQHNHVTDTWSTNPGTYNVTKSATGNIHAITISYTNPAFDQAGIIEIIGGTTLKLEVVISSYTVVPTPETGFGADPALGTLNIQTYIKEVAASEPWVGVWLSEGANVAPIVYADPVNVDIAEVIFNRNNTLSLRQHNHVTDAWSTNPGTYNVTKSATGNIHAITISYTNPAFDQAGIIEMIAGTPTTMKMEVVISTYTVVPTPTGGFGADPALNSLNIQTYEKQ